MDGTYSSFTADYMGKSVRVQGKTYPAGFSVPALLNAFPDGDFRKESNGLQMLYMQSDLSCNRLVAETFFRAGKEMRDTLLLLKSIPPFTSFDEKAEEAVIDSIFRQENIAPLSTIASTPCIHGAPVSDDRQMIGEDYELLYNALRGRLSFYSNITADYLLAAETIHDIFKQLPSSGNWSKTAWIAAIRKCNENNGTEFDGAFCDTYPSNTARFAEVQAKTQYVCDASAVSRRMQFTRYVSFLATDFFEGLRCGHYPIRCKICGRYFLITDGHCRKYCDGIDPNDAKGRPCRKVGADKAHREKESHDVHPIYTLCNSRLDTMRQQLKRGKITPELREAAKRVAQDCRSRAVSDYSYYKSRYKQDMTLEALYAAAKKRLGQ